MNKVTIKIQGGIAHVSEIPDNTEVEIRDYDIADIDPTSKVVKTDEHGNQYTEQIFKSNNGIDERMLISQLDWYLSILLDKNKREQFDQSLREQGLSHDVFWGLKTRVNEYLNKK